MSWYRENKVRTRTIQCPACRTPYQELEGDWSECPWCGYDYGMGVDDYMDEQLEEEEEGEGE